MSHKQASKGGVGRRAKAHLDVAHKDLLLIWLWTFEDSGELVPAVERLLRMVRVEARRAQPPSEVHTLRANVSPCASSRKQ